MKLKRLVILLIIFMVSYIYFGFSALMNLGATIPEAAILGSILGFFITWILEKGLEDKDSHGKKTRN